MIRPFGKGTLFVEPMHGDGYAAGVIFVQHDERLPKIFARVLDVSESEQGIRKDDLVVVVPHAPDDIQHSGGSTWVVNEQSVKAVFVCEDGLPYYAEGEAA